VLLYSNCNCFIARQLYTRSVFSSIFGETLNSQRVKYRHLNDVIKSERTTTLNAGKPQAKLDWSFISSSRQVSLLFRRKFNFLRTQQKRTRDAGTLPVNWCPCGAAWELKISPPRFPAECRNRRPIQGGFLRCVYTWDDSYVILSTVTAAMLEVCLLQARSSVKS